jgi:hypothetical protein
MAGAAPNIDRWQMTMNSTRLEPIEIVSADDISVRPDPWTGHLRLVLRGDPLEDDQTVTVPVSVLVRLVDHQHVGRSHDQRHEPNPDRTRDPEPEPWLNFLPRLRGYPSRITRA